MRMVHTGKQNINITVLEMTIDSKSIYHFNQSLRNTSPKSCHTLYPFARLNLLYNNNSTSANTGIISQPLYFTLAGNIDNNASYIPGTSDRSFYWSSTITSSNAQALGLHNNGQVEPISAYGAGKFRGTSIRCVAI